MALTRKVLLLFALVNISGIVLYIRWGSEAGSDVFRGAVHRADGNSSSSDYLTVVLAAGSNLLQGCVVAINSAAMHAREPRRLVFRIVTLENEREAIVKGLRERLPAHLDVDAVAFDPWLPRVSPLIGGNSSKRAELFTVFNFAAFYLPELFPDSERILYLDTDVVVLCDLFEELASLDLGGKPVAAAADCSQRMDRYVDTGRVKSSNVESKLGFQLHLAKTNCVTNRGVVLMDRARWVALNLTGAMEVLVLAHLSEDMGPLWRSGVSQPPFLVAIAGRFYNLGIFFNVRGLGRGKIPPTEVGVYRHLGAWQPYFDQFLHKAVKGQSMSPYVSPWAHQAKILHFNGKLKPERAIIKSSKPLLPPPENISHEELQVLEDTPLCSCGKHCVRPCAGLWWDHFPRNDTIAPA